jgi:hypothetical protein
MANNGILFPSTVSVKGWIPGHGSFRMEWTRNTLNVFSLTHRMPGPDKEN